MCTMAARIGWGRSATIPQARGTTASRRPCLRPCGSARSPRCPIRRRTGGSPHCCTNTSMCTTATTRRRRSRSSCMTLSIPQPARRDGPRPVRHCSNTRSCSSAWTNCSPKRRCLCRRRWRWNWSTTTSHAPAPCACGSTTVMAIPCPMYRSPSRSTGRRGSATGRPRSAARRATIRPSSHGMPQAMGR